MRNNFLLGLMEALRIGKGKSKFLPKRDRIELKKARRKRLGSTGSNNHSKGQSDKRRKMAADSNKINRDRIKKWKY